MFEPTQRPQGWTTKHEEGFEQLWLKYPPRNGRKNDKGGARIEYKALSPSEKLLEEMLKAVEEQKKSREWRREGGAFIPDLRKWIKHDMWEDEVEAVVSTAIATCRRCGLNKTIHDIVKQFGKDGAKVKFNLHDDLVTRICGNFQ